MMRLLLLVLSCACATGCRVPPKGGLAEVEALLAARGVGRLRWNQSQAEDDEARRAVDRLLRDELTPSIAVELAIAQSPLVQATLERLGVAQADAVQAGLLSNPSIGVHPGLPIGSPSWSGVAWEVSVTMQILDLFVLPLRKKLARIELEHARLVVASDLWTITTDVRERYVDAIAAQQRLALQRTFVESAAVNAEFAQRQEQAGTRSELQLAVEEDAAAQAQLELVRAEREAVVARERLVRVLGLRSADRMRLPAQLPPVPDRDPELDALEETALAQRLDLQAAESEARLFARALATAKHTRFLTGVAIGGDAHREPEVHKVIGPSLTIELPIFDQGQAKIAKLMAQARRARREADVLAIDVRSEVRDKVDGLRSARSLAARYKDVVIPLRERTVELAQQQYDAMLLGLPQLLACKQSEIAAWREYLASVRDYWITRAELERALGTSLGGDK